MKRLLILLSTLFLTTVVVSGQIESTKAITGVTVIDGTGLSLQNAVIVIKGSRIAQFGPQGKIKIPADAQRIDATGKFVIPGLADMHHHLGEGTFSLSESPSDFEENLRLMLGWGFTFIFNQGIPNLSAFSKLKNLSASDSAPYPHFFGVGVRFAAKGGHGSSLGAYTPESPKEARAQVRELKAGGVDGVKIVHDDLSYIVKQPRPMLKSEVVAAIIDEAHKQGLKAYVHAPILKHAKEVLRAGADGLVHAVDSDPIDGDFIDLLKKNRAVYITTHAIFEAATDIAGWARREAAFDERGLVPKKLFELGMNPLTVQAWEARLDNLAYAKTRLPIMRSNLKKVQDAGVTVVLGSDNSSAGSGTGIVLGLGSQLELTLLDEAGLTPLEAIQAATINAARMIGREKDFGTITAGKIADLIILDQNPLEDIGNVRFIHRVIKGGVFYDPADMLRASARQLSSSNCAANYQSVPSGSGHHNPN
jgi:imidazolonepropionase-like amidohydrolase